MDWLTRAKDMLIDLYRDGYSLIGALAPILSISFTTAKAFDVSVNLRGISYAWALAPITIWLIVAYARRWNEHYVAIGQGLRDRNTWFQQAAFFLANSRWPRGGERVFRAQGNEESFVNYVQAFKSSPEYVNLSNALASLRQAARDGDINVWGYLNARAVLNIELRPAQAAVFEEVPSDHWRSYSVAPEQLLFAPDQVYSSEHGNKFIGDRSVASLMVNKRQIEAFSAKLARAGT